MVFNSYKSSCNYKRGIKEKKEKKKKKLSAAVFEVCLKALKVIFIYISRYRYSNSFLIFYIILTLIYFIYIEYYIYII